MGLQQYLCGDKSPNHLLALTTELESLEIVFLLPSENLQAGVSSQLLNSRLFHRFQAEIGQAHMSADLIRVFL
jgi:hypothetical protein